MPPGFLELSFPQHGVTLSPLSARVTQKEFAHDLAELDITSDRHNSARYRTGMPIRLLWGVYPNVNEFVGYVHHIEPAVRIGEGVTHNHVVVIGASFTLKQERQRSWSSVYPEQIARQIARENSFAVRVDASRYPMEAVVQANTSDWSFLADLARKAGFTLYVIGSELQFRDRSRLFAEQRVSALYLRRGDIYRFQPTVGEDNEDRPTDRIVYGLSPTGDVFGARQTYLFDQDPGLPQPLYTRAENIDVSTPALARKILEAAHARSSFYYRAELEAPGNPRVRQGSILAVDGYGERYDGFWYVIGTEHLLTRDHYNMRLQLGRTKALDVGARPSVIAGRVLASSVKRPQTVLANSRWRSEYVSA